MEKKSNFVIFIFTLLILFNCVFFSGCIDVYERSPIDFIAISSDGSKIISHDSELQFQIWNINSGEELFRNTYKTGNIKWIQDGKKFLITGSNKIRIFNSSSFEEIWNNAGSFSFLDISESGLSLSTSWTHFEDHRPIFNITLWDLAKNLKIKVLNITTKSSRISLSQTGTRFVYIPKTENSLEIINVSNENITKTLNLINQSVRNISKCHYIKWLEEDSRIAMVANFKNDGICFYYWNVSDGSVILKKNYSFYMIYPSFSPDGMNFIMSSGVEYPTNVSVVDTITGEVKYSLFLSEKGVSSTDWSPDGSLIAAGSNDGIIKVWNATTGELVQTLLTPKDHRVPT